MNRRTRRNHLPAFKAKMELTTVKGDATLAEYRQHVAGSSTLEVSP